MPTPIPTYIQLCGVLVAEVGGRRVDTLLPGRKGRQLFACLVMGRDRPLTRDELIDDIWHDKSPADPDGTFSTLLTRLRSAVGRDRIHGRSELVLDLGEDAWVDWDVAHRSVAAAEALLAAGKANEAWATACAGLKIARRSLLPGISTPWLELRRRELVEAAAALLEASGRAALQLGGEHLPAAERSARELIDREPYRESGYALLMETHAARGNIAEALRVYDDLRRLLRDELGLIPAAPLNALAGRLLEQHETASEPVRAPQSVKASRPLPAPLAAFAERPLAGRGEELKRLTSAALETPAGACRVLVINGEPGIGKTRLAAEIAARSHAAGSEVIHGRAQRDAITPLQPFVEGLRGYLEQGDDAARELLPVMGPELSELARIVPELRPVVPPASDDAPLNHQRLYDAVAALIGSIARRRPLLLVLEDLHWCDQATALLLRYVARAATGARLTVLVTLRDDLALEQGVRGAFQDLLRERTLERVVLHPLDAADSARLIGGRYTDAQRLHAQAGGNPFLIEELLCTGSDDGWREAVELRLEPLPGPVRETLAAGAAVGPTFDLAAVARRTGRSRRAVADAVGVAVRHRLIVADPLGADRFAFRHGLVRDALLAT